MPVRLSPAVKFLLVAQLAFFIIQQSIDQFFGGNLLSWLALVPSTFIVGFRFWQIFTYSFLHADVMHLFLNLLMLWMLGSEMEGLWGRRRFLTYYFFCVLSAGLAYLGLQLLFVGGLGTPMVGASGGIYGLLIAYGVFFGERQLAFMMLFPMKAKHFVWVLAGVEFMTSVFSRSSGLASVAHLGGMIGGFSYLWFATYWKIRKKQRQSGSGTRTRNSSKNIKKNSASHLKLVIDNKLDPRRQSSTEPGGNDDDQGGKPKTWH